MNRYELRRQRRLQNPAIAAGYQEMAVELQLMRALDKMREQQKMTEASLPREKDNEQI